MVQLAANDGDRALNFKVLVGSKLSFPLDLFPLKKKK